jgi:hypothetical protein
VLEKRNRYHWRVPQQHLQQHPCTDFRWGACNGIWQLS